MSVSKRPSSVSGDWYKSCSQLVPRALKGSDGHKRSRLDGGPRAEVGAAAGAHHPPVDDASAAARYLHGRRRLRCDAFVSGILAFLLALQIARLVILSQAEFIWFKLLHCLP